MMTATNTRKEARESLTGKWGKVALIFLAYGVITFVLEFILRYAENNDVSLLHLIILIVQLIVTVPMAYGMVISFMKLKRGEEVGVFDFLTLGFSNFKKSWDIAWNEFLVMVVPALIIFAVLVFLSFYSLTSSGLMMPSSPATRGSATGSSAIVIIAFIVIIACSVWSVVKRYSIALSRFIAYDKPEMSGKEAVEESQAMMRGNKGNLFVLELSFIGWAILAALTFGIGVLWLYPYIQISQICFYEELKNNIN